MSYIAIILKCVFIYVYLIILLRFLGKKEFSQLSIFDFIVFLMISEFMIMYFDGDLNEFIKSVVATFTLVLIDKVCSYFALRSKKIRDLLEGKPTYIIYNGKTDQNAMTKQRYNIDSLCQHLRSQQVGSISEVQFALLETNGDLSVFLKKDCSVIHPEPLIIDGLIMHEALNKMNLDENWLIKELKKYHISDYQSVFYCIAEKERLFIIKK